MSFWRAETLLEKLPGLIEPYDATAVDCAAYTLHVGNEIHVSPDQEVRSPNRHTKRRLDHDEGFTIPPGQFAFLITREKVSVPNNAIAFLSIKARIKFSGLINISGFHVDPGYNGKLLFSVLNVGPRPLHLQQGQALFLIWYADLDGDTERGRERGQSFNEIEPEMINRISGEILSLQSLSDKLNVLDNKLKRRKIIERCLWGLGVVFAIPVIVRWWWPTIQAWSGIGTP